MSLRLEMLQVARLASNVLGESAELVRQFLADQLHPAGGFKDRAGGRDLYYTVFGIDAMVAMRMELPVDPLVAYLRTLGAGDALDFVHVACLARGWAAMPAGACGEDDRERLIRRLESHRTPDGGYDANPGAPAGTLYGCFLALGAYQDLGRELPDPRGLARCVQGLRAPDGGYANHRDLPAGLTPSTAAAATLLRHLREPIDASLSHWLLGRCRPEGGFFATPSAPIPDLLSTATALHALSGLHADVAAIKEPCLDFLDTLWSPRGGFHGTWEDDALDCEYAYYALLALGHLSL